ncbi:MAG: App1 family protein [Cyclobacteriaceae bacterium]
MKTGLKLYRGYVNDQELVVFGHVFKSRSPDSFRIDRHGINHAISIFRMFTIKPMADAVVILEFENLKVETKTLKDGYFRFNIPYTEDLASGWHHYKIACQTAHDELVAHGELLKPYKSRFGIISDIDDTFLVSHTSSFFKKLFVLLSRNIDKRKIFEDVAEHYRALSEFGQDEEAASNAFFYVSSSEWNLYDFIEKFAVKHQLPKAVIKLKKIKTGLADFLFTGKGSHDHKFNKIKDLISFYPELEYVLFGDDTQKDPFLYERICKVFPKNIRVVYIRQTSKNKKRAVEKAMETIGSLSIETLYYQHSKTAIAHSKSIGII